MQSPSIRILFILTCLFVSPAVCAQSVTITVSGQINEPSCTPTLTGPRVTGNAIVLEDADTTDFPSQYSTAKPTRITFALTGCGKQSVNNMWVHFNSTNVSDGIMVPTTGPTTVGFEIVDVDSSGTSTGNRVHAGGGVVTTPNANQGTAAPLSATSTWPNRTASKSYDVRYIRTSATAPEAGAISTQATYQVIFYGSSRISVGDIERSNQL